MEMIILIKIGLGLLLVFLGMALVFKPIIVKRIVRIVKEIILNESFLLIERRKLGLLFVLVGLLLFYTLPIGMIVEINGQDERSIKVPTKSQVCALTYSHLPPLSGSLIYLRKRQLGVGLQVGIYS